jgi:hypothetical protein
MYESAAVSKPKGRSFRPMPLVASVGTTVLTYALGFDFILSTILGGVAYVGANAMTRPKLTPGEGRVRP